MLFRNTSLLLLASLTVVRAIDREVTFEHDVRPILKAHCTNCHGEEETPKGGVDLRLRRFMDKPLKEGGHVVVPGKPDDSELVLLVREGEMPKKGKKLTPEQISILERWVAQGAKITKPEPETLAPGMFITDEDRQWWAFKPIARPEVPSLEFRVSGDSNSKPETQNTKPVSNPIDAFVLARLREQKLEFAPEADKRTLIRRVTLDLTGLLPTPEEVDAFAADSAPDAYDKLVDRLLASPAYGERWARHWLDIAGYADSNGFMEVDSPRLHAWRYRDYVIQSFNADKSWKDFIVEQLAGDELAGVAHADTQQAVQDLRKRDNLIATAFLRLAPDGTDDAAPDIKLARNQTIADEMRVVSTSLLGLTVACAQCHDHRYDPISQADYYRFRAIFDPAYDWQKWRTPAQRLYSLYTPEERAKAAEIEKQAVAITAEAQAMSKKFLDEVFEEQIVKLPEEERAPYRAARATAEKDRTPEQKALIKKYPKALALYSLDLYDKKRQQQVLDKQAEAKKLRDTKPPEGMVMALTEVKAAAPETRLFNRGDHDQPKQVVQPGELTVLERAPLQPEPPASGTTGRRLAYAHWLTSGQHPLVARVLVNRFWLNHFGRGLVNTPGDFGALGEKPSHPELLDWLASEFMDGGWKLKRLQRLMVLSTTYRQSSRSDASLRTDADNRLYGRFKVQRLDAEALRDSMLAAAGTLNRGQFGPPVGIARDLSGRIVVGQEELNANRDIVKVKSLGKDDYRRSIYVQVRRKQPLTVLETFDAPIMTPNCELRNSSTVAPQSLLLMNDTFVLDTSRDLATRLRGEAQGDARAQIFKAWRLLYGRAPSENDILRGLAFIAEQTEAVRNYHHGIQHAKDAPVPDPHLDALASYCQVLFSSNRFLYVE
jgi:cytochrome c553